MNDFREVLRDEKKYLISKPTYEILKSRLSAVLSSDGHYDSSAPYFIRSLYFDDLDKRAFHDKLDGVENRTKYRLRFYNHDTSYIVFEKKEKHGDKSHKTGVQVSRSLAESMITGNIDSLNESQIPLLREFYILSRYRRLAPSVLVDYYRRAYCFPVGDVRLTLDSDICSGGYSTDFFGKDVASFPTLEDGLSVFEIKYNGFLPPHISRITEDLPLTLSSNSKYCLSLNLLV